MFNYDLPAERIAQRPAAHFTNRHDSKLLWAKSGPSELEFIKDKVFSDLPDILRPGDLLIFNNSKVIPTRFFLTLESKELEVLLLRQVQDNIWEALAKPMKKFRAGLEFALSSEIKAKVIGRTQDLSRLLLELDSKQDILDAIKATGTMPIPPYIRSGRSDAQDLQLYQTEYAQHEGSVAAPTAGLHFSKELISKLEARKIEIDFVTLHVSQWSFSPIAQDFKVSQEYYQIAKDTWSNILQAKNQGRRVIAVGTTSVRALESRALLDSDVGADFQASSLFIKPGFEFKIIDCMITNFHQPNSTHLALVSAFLGQGVQEVYQHALGNEYRFLSYGDGCLFEKNL